MSDELTRAESSALDAWTPLAPPAGFADRVLDAVAARGMATPQRASHGAMVAGVIVAVAAAVAIVLVGLRRGDDPPPPPSVGPRISEGPPLIDAGLVPILEDAAEPDRIDAHAVEIADVATVEIRGKRAELRRGGGAWTRLLEGVAWLDAGNMVKLGAGTAATVRAGGAVFDLDAAAIFETEPGGVLRLDAGHASARAQGIGIDVVGGRITPWGELGLDAGPVETRIRIENGTAALIGANGERLEMARGDVAVVARDGSIRAVAGPPRYFDVRVAAGESVTIHDPMGATAVQIAFGRTCPTDGAIEIDRDARFAAARMSAGTDRANVMIQAGIWAYRVRCGDGAPFASGRIVVLRDDGARRLPPVPAPVTIDADGRTWRVEYKSTLPSLVVRARGVARVYRLHLANGDNEATFNGVLPAISTPTITVPSAQLREGTYTFWFERDGVPDPKRSTLVIAFDQTAPQISLQTRWGADIDVHGAALDGWTATIDGVALPIIDQRFAAKVPLPVDAKSLAIRFEHPQRGVHVYVRRPGK